MTPGEVLALSDDHDRQLQLRLDAYREGYADGGRGQWSAGYAAAVADMKASQHDLYRFVRQYLTAWDGLREHFARPRRSDYTGRGKAA